MELYNHINKQNKAPFDNRSLSSSLSKNIGQGGKTRLTTNLRLNFVCQSDVREKTPYPLATIGTI